MVNAMRPSPRAPRLPLRPQLLLLPLLLAACVHGAPPQPSNAPIRNPSKLDSTAMQQQPDKPVAEIIASRVPGVRLVRAADGTLSLRIRGEGSFYSDGQPLIVIDGLEVDPSASGGLSMVNPHDIETIEVVKDAASLSLYGIRGSNGVIIIKTKHGHP